MIRFETTLGNFTIEFHEKEAPQTVANFLRMAVNAHRRTDDGEANPIRIPEFRKLLQENMEMLKIDRWMADNPCYVKAVGNDQHTALGAARWIQIGPFQFQPSEPAKVVLAIAIAALMARSSFRRIQELVLPLAKVAEPS